MSETELKSVPTAEDIRLILQRVLSAETYPSIFLVEVENKLDDTVQTVSFSYTDVLTKDVQMQLI